MPPDQGAAEIASVPASRALVWYGDAMRLWKRGPATLSTLAVLTVLAQVAFELVPDVGPLAAKIVVPLIACGMLSTVPRRPRRAHDRASRTCSPRSARAPRR
jgi:hypothetical protein